MSAAMAVVHIAIIARCLLGNGTAQRQDLPCHCVRHQGGGIALHRRFSWLQASLFIITIIIIMIIIIIIIVIT